MKKKTNKLFILLMAAGIILFAVIAFILVRATSTVTAIVPNQEISAGTRIDNTMLKTIEVPVNTPQGYITDVSSLEGQKLKVSVSENQLLYVNDVMSSWEDFSDGTSIPDDYVVTSIQIPSNRAVGGMITAGDTVDILGVPNAEYKTTSKETLANYLGGISENAYGAEGMNVYWVLANVKILETDSTLSTSNESSISTVTEEESSSSEGAFYIVALSYNDYKKVRLAEQYLDLWMSIAPEYNNENGEPMLDVMNQQDVKALDDAQAQSVLEAAKEEEANGENTSDETNDAQKNEDQNANSETQGGESGNEEDSGGDVGGEE